MIRRLPLGGLGAGLLALGAAAWVTALPLLLARAGLPSPLLAAGADAAHAVTGTGAAVFLVLKIWRVGFRRRVPAGPRVEDWHRWLSAALGLLYAANLVSGFGAVAPLPGRGHAAMVNLHLLTAVWALPLTLWHAWRHRRLLKPALTPRPRAVRIALAMAGIGLVAAGGAALPFAFSEAGVDGSGPGWRPAGLGGLAITSVASTGEGVLAGGDGLYLERRGGWRRLALDAGGDSPFAAHGHAGAGPPPPAGGVVAIAVSPADHVLIATTGGVFAADRPQGPYQRLPFYAGHPLALAINPRQPTLVWLTTDQGPYLTLDGGITWTSFAAGLADPGRTGAVAWWRGDAYAGGPGGAYRFDGQTWEPAGPRTGEVTALAASPDSLSGLRTDGTLETFDGRGWRVAGGAHQHGGGPAHAHVLCACGPLLVVGGGPERATVASGGGPSWPAGSWLPAGSGLPGPPTALAGGRAGLYAATDDGVYLRPAAGSPPAGLVVWLLLTAVAVAAGLVAAAYAFGMRPRPAAIRLTGSPLPARRRAA